MMAARHQGTLRHELFKVLKVTSLVALLVVLGSLIAPWIAPLILGEQFRPSGLPLMILLWGWAVFCLHFPLGIALNALDHPEIVAASGIFTLIQTFVLNLWLIPRFGASGAAATFGLSFVTTLILCASAVGYFSSRGKGL
jgi:O-antigen/teichoic acid export membrane protein